MIYITFLYPFLLILYCIKNVNNEVFCNNKILIKYIHSEHNRKEKAKTIAIGNNYSYSEIIHEKNKKKWK